MRPPGDAPPAPALQLGAGFFALHDDTVDALP
jgi:hypothetical protein